MASPLLSTPEPGSSRRRTNTGCLTCRQRRVKCNEAKPLCSNCARLTLGCEWAEHVPLDVRRDRIRMELRSRPPVPIVPKDVKGSTETLLAAQGGSGSPNGNSAAPLPTFSPDGEQAFLDVASPRPSPSMSQGPFNAIVSPGFFQPPSPLTEMQISPTASLAGLPTLQPLTRTDYQALDYYQNQVAFGFGSKSPAWSTHALLMKTASRNATVLHLLLAASSVEMSWHCGTSSQSMLDNAEENYRRGQQLLVGEITHPDSDPLVVMASFWFLYLYQRRRPPKLRISYHALSRLMCDYIGRSRLDQVLSYTDTSSEGYLGMATVESAHHYSPEKRALLARLASWLFWVDAQSCFQGDGGNMARLLAQSASTRGLLEMYEVSRATLQLNWQGGYPVGELVDDLQNSSALELIHHTWVLVQEVNEAATVAEECFVPMDRETSHRIKNRMHALRRKYPISAVFHLTMSEDRVRDRLMANSDWAVANYYALCIYRFRCSLMMAGEDGGGTASLLTSSPQVQEDEGITETVETLLNLVQRSLAAGDKGQQDRLQWPLFWAGIETTDTFKLFWIFDHLTNQGLHTALRLVLAEQQEVGDKLGMGRVRRICQAACADTTEVALGG
ncbi:hypothetical protein B0T22DRAFT_241469 [Podospora appendiculata]|uniref:Zn(2)-C6 fungal-type domain-containing protein n=1 Tax=Podospora appendiculata TaxID=314037 RepID=A0AAE0X6Z0_9PEZI|nr:hypothetical protein B0T22DRAFT_241469 [Podospora appendiculata]